MRLTCTRGRKNFGLAAGVLKRLWQENEGQDLVEYGLLLLLVALVCISSITVIGAAISNIFSNAATSLTSAAAT